MFWNIVDICIRDARYALILREMGSAAAFSGENAVDS